MVKQIGGRYLVLFKDGGHKTSPRFHLFVSDVNQGNEGLAPGMEKLSLDLSRAVKHTVGCGSAWDL